MLRLQDNEVIYNNSENLGLVQDMNFIESGFVITLNGSMTFIPQEDATESEKEVFNAYHEYYKDSGGVKPKPVVEPSNELIPKTDLQILQETVDALVLASLEV